MSQDDAGPHVSQHERGGAARRSRADAYYARNPNLLRTRGSYESLRGDTTRSTRCGRCARRRGVNRGYQAGVLRADGTLAPYTAAARRRSTAATACRPISTATSSSPSRPAISSAASSSSDDGTALVRAARPTSSAEFLASTDERFRPVYLSSAPDGTLYVVDMYRGIIQHRGYITEYLRDHIVVAQARAADRARPHLPRRARRRRSARRGPSCRTTTPAQLVSAVASRTAGGATRRSGCWSSAAMRRCVRRAEADWRRTRSDGRARGCTRSGRSTASTAIDADTVTARAGRSVARRSRCRRCGWPSAGCRQSSRGAGSDRHCRHGHRRDARCDWSVRRQLAASLGELSEPQRDALLAMNLLRRFDGDPIVARRDAERVRRQRAGTAQALLQTTTDTSEDNSRQLDHHDWLHHRRERRDGADSRRMFWKWSRKTTRPAWQRSACSRGAEWRCSRTSPASVAEAAGGAGPVRGGATPERAAGPAARRPSRRRPPPPRGQGAAPLLKLPRRAGDCRLCRARFDGELGRRAEALARAPRLAGQTGTAPAVAPLTADEQQRFAAGRQVYQTLCTACHQADGRGREKLAPSLVGSSSRSARPTSRPASCSTARKARPG